MEFGKERLVVGSLYGPNQNEENFFHNLNSYLSLIQIPCLILGGDLNATWDNRNVNDNLDVHAMNNIPSVFRSNKLREICVTHNLTDPYRALYPNKKDYTFVPSAIDMLNRSRIDFFLVKFPLIKHVKNCTISHSLLSAYFDHKCINLTFKQKNGIKNFPVKANILKEDEVNWQVSSSVLETYIQHAIVNNNYSELQKNEHLLLIGQINAKIQESLDLKLQLANLGVNNFLELRIAGIKPEVEDLFSLLPDLSFFEISLVRNTVMMYCSLTRS
jgi:hypothetical protein